MTTLQFNLNLDDLKDFVMDSSLDHMVKSAIVFERIHMRKNGMSIFKLIPEYCIIKVPLVRTFEPPSAENKATQCMTTSHPSLAASIAPKKGFYSALDDFIGKTAFTS